MANSLFVGNLTWGTDDAAVMALFTGYAVDSASVVYGSDGRSRGYALVEMSSPDEAERAINNLNGVLCDGRDVRIKYNSRRQNAAPGAGSSGVRGGGAGGYQPRVPGASIYVGNLSWDVSWQTLKDTFSAYQPEYSDVKKGYDGRSRGWGIVRFASPEMAQRAITEMDGAVVEGRAIEVRLDKGPPGAGAGKGFAAVSDGSGVYQQDNGFQGGGNGMQW